MPHCLLIHPCGSCNNFCIFEYYRDICVAVQQLYWVFLRLQWVEKVWIHQSGVDRAAGSSGTSSALFCLVGISFYDRKWGFEYLHLNRPWTSYTCTNGLLFSHPTHMSHSPWQTNHTQIEMTCLRQSCIDWTNKNQVNKSGLFVAGWLAGICIIHRTLLSDNRQ